MKMTPFVYMLSGALWAIAGMSAGNEEWLITMPSVFGALILGFLGSKMYVRELYGQD